MTSSWSKAASLISGASSALAGICLVSAALADEPKLFSRADGSQKFDAYLVSNTPVGLQQNRLAAIHFVSPGKEATEAEWIVNCNETFPQVVSPTGSNSEIGIDRVPVRKDRFKFELWWSVCKGQFQKASRTEPSSSPDAQTAVAGGDRPKASSPNEANNPAAGITSALQSFLIKSVQAGSVGFSYDGSRMTELQTTDIGNRLTTVAVSQTQTYNVGDDQSTIVALIADLKNSALCLLIGRSLRSCVFFDMERQPGSCLQKGQDRSSILFSCDITRGYGTGLLNSGDAFFALSSGELQYAGYLPTLDYDVDGQKGGRSFEAKATNEVTNEDSEQPTDPMGALAVKRCPVITNNSQDRKAGCERYVLDKSRHLRSVGGRDSLDKSMLSVYADYLHQ